MKDYLNLSKLLLKNLNKDHSIISQKLCIGENIQRKVNVPMSDSCENNIALLISEILKSKKYKYIIDAYFSCKPSPKAKSILYRPDIVILDGNKIVGIVEVKAQMGYCGDLKPADYNKKLNTFLKSKITIKYRGLDKDKNLRKAIKFWDSFENIDKKHEKISFTISPDTNYYVLTVLSRNHHANVEKTINSFEKVKNNIKNKYDKIHFYALYNEKVWYDSLIEENANQIFEIGNKTSLDSKLKELHGFKRFVDDITNNLK